MRRSATSARERLADEPLDDAVDRFPAEPEVARDREQRGVARHLDDLPLQRLGIARAWPCPGHRLDPDSALPAIHPPQPRREHRAHPEGVLGAPAALPERDRGADAVPLRTRSTGRSAGLAPAERAAPAPPLGTPRPPRSSL